MKLIDLLVQELPKRGGWPDGAVECCRHYGANSIDFYDETGNWDDDCYLKYGKDFAKGCIYEKTSGSHRLQSISRSEYESALAASQKPAWSDEGLPTVGCECEFISNDTSWGVVRVIGMDDGKVVIKPSGEIYYGITPSNRQVFRPLRTESERKRDETISEIGKASQLISNNKEQIKHIAKHIYDAIAAGKIPGVRLDD